MQPVANAPQSLEEYNGGVYMGTEYIDSFFPVCSIVLVVAVGVGDAVLYML